MDEGKFCLNFRHELKSADFIKEASKLVNEDGLYIFTAAESWNATSLLKRAAELYSVLPDNPLVEYQKKIKEFSDTEVQRTEAERLVKKRVGQVMQNHGLIVLAMPKD